MTQLGRATGRIWQWLRQGVPLLAFGALGMSLVIVGLFACLDYPQRFPAWLWLPIGVTLVAFGEFLFAVIAECVAPGTDGRICGVLEFGPWAVVAIVWIPVLVGAV